MNIRKKLHPIEEGKCPAKKFNEYSEYAEICPSCEYADLEMPWFDLVAICNYNGEEDQSMPA